MNFSEAKILAVPGYMGDIRGSDFPVRLMISFLSIVRRAGSSGARRVEIVSITGWNLKILFDNSARL